MKHLIFLMFLLLLQGCLNDLDFDEVRVYDMMKPRREGYGSPELVQIQNEDKLISKLNHLMLKKQVIVKVYPAYKIELLKNGEIEKVLLVRANIVIVRPENKTFRIKENLEEYITENIK